jgi:site-specific DNA-cytosine methylase
VDCSQTITAVEWFFGYGGNHIGLKRVLPNLRLIAACEIEGYATANTVAKMEAGLMDAAPIWSNCKTFPIEQFRGLVDIFIASYPCQGFSAAGKREGQKDSRFLWPWVIRAVAVIQPRWVFFENVEGHVTLGLSTVISDLEAAGYRVKEGIFSAAECGAPQQRKRVFILGVHKSERRGARWAEWSRRFGQSASLQSGSMADAECSERRPQSQNGMLANRNESGRQQDASRLRECGELADAESDNGRSKQSTEESECRRSRPSGSSGLADANQPGLQGRQCSELSECSGQRIAGACGPWHWPAFVARRGEEQHEWEPPRVIKTERGLGGGVNGRAANVDRLRLLGNGVYPATASLCHLVSKANAMTYKTFLRSKAVTAL